MNRKPEQLKEHLKAPDYASIKVGRSAPGGQSAVEAIARELANTPKFYAHCGSVDSAQLGGLKKPLIEMTITHEEYRALLAHGAQDTTFEV